MKKYDGLWARSRIWRMEGLALQEICKRLSLSKGTVYHWIKDIPLQRRHRGSSGHRIKISHAFADKRKKAYVSGMEMFSSLSLEASFRDFILLYMTEGYRKGINSVAVGNSNSSLVALAAYWLRKLSLHKMEARVQVYEDQDLNAVRRHWGRALGIAPSAIKLQPKSNAGGLHGRKTRSIYGVCTVRVADTYLRQRIQAWMDLVEKDWKSRGIA